MLFSNPNSLLVLSGDGLLFYLNKASPLNFCFEKDVVDDLEVKNPQKLSLQLKSFIENNRIGSQEGLIILTDNVCFQKYLTELDPAKIQLQTQSFLDEVPLDPAKTASLIIQEDGKTLVLATNKQLYLSICKVLKGLNWKISAIFPAASLSKLGISQTDNLDSNSVKKILSSQDKLESMAFSFSEKELEQKVDKEQPTQEKSEGPLSHKNQTLIAIILIIAILSILTWFFFSKYNPYFKGKQSKPRSSPASNIVQSTDSAKFQEATNGAKAGQKIDKGELKVQILNGTGIAGQAQDLADLLKTYGYENFTLGNSQKSDVQETIVVLDSDLSDVINQEIEQALSQIFQSIKIQKDQTFNFEISITTGKLK